MSYLLLKEPPLGLEANFGHVSATFGTYRQTNKLKFSTQITSDCLSLFIVLSCFFSALEFSIIHLLKHSNVPSSGDCG